MNSEDALSQQQSSDLPRLTIAHSLLATASIAVVLAIYKATTSDSTTIPMQWLLITAWVPGAIAIGLGIYFLIWAVTRAVQGKSSLFVEPGAKFAALMGVHGLISLAYLFIWRAISWTPIPTFPTSIVLFLFFESIALGIAAFALYWIRDTAWRVIIVGKCATIFRGLLVNFLYLTGNMYWPFMSRISVGSIVFVGIFHSAVMVALALSIAGDWQSHRTRHWTHYLGVVLLCLALFSTWCTFAWDLLINSSF